jgi:hypothetical protein
VYMYMSGNSSTSRLTNIGADVERLELVDLA